MRYLGIDYGLKRIGLAVSDASERMAFPLTTLHKTTNERLFNDLTAIIQNEKIEALVVGHPKGLDGQITTSTRQAENFAAKLRSRTGLEVFLVDETLTSSLAEEKLKQARISGRKHKAIVDQQAAVEILDAFLAAKHSDGGPMRLGHVLD